MIKSLNKRSIVLNLIRLTMFLMISVSFNVNAQGNVKIDEIPHDISYYRESRITKPLVKAIYGRPTHADSTEVFGTKIPFNQLWRTGANEATEVKFYDSVTFGDTIVAAGTYVLYTIPGEKEWELILSSNTDVLGTFQYDAMFDVARIKIPVTKAEKLETFAITFKKKEASEIIMTLGWGSTRVKVPLQFKTKEHYAANYDASTLKKKMMK